MQASFTLYLPQIAVRIDNAIALHRLVVKYQDRNRHLLFTKQIPRPSLEEISLGENTFILEHVLEVLGVVDHYARWECRDGDLEGLEAKFLLALDEPREQLVASLQEEDAISNERESVWGFPCSWSVLN